MLLQTSRLAAADKGAKVDRPPQVVVQQVAQHVPAQWDIPGKLLPRYGHDNLRYLHQWWQVQGSAMLQGDTPLVMISGLQLYCAFNLFTGFEGPWCHKKKWYAAADQAPPQARLEWGSRCKLFLMMWKTYLKAQGVNVPQKMTRPFSAAISRWLVCYRLRWTKDQIDRVDSILFGQLQRQLITGGDVACLRAPKTG